jgi:putative NADH-flavin reductase
MKITVFGAAGRTGQQVVEQALGRGHEVVAFVRSASKLPFQDSRLTVVEGDAYDGTNIDEAVADADAVISTLGQSKETPDDLLTVAGQHISDAMEVHGVERFVTLVGAGVRTDDETVSLGGKIMGSLLKLLSRAVLEDAKSHVEDVRESSLRWTVVRVPRLGDDDPRGDYRTGEDLQLGFEAVARADVADFLLDVVEDDRYVG